MHLIIKKMHGNRYAVLFLICTLCVARPVLATADRIILKDGTVEESDKIWESEKYIHFILKGTTSVEIRFLKEIVERVESASFSFPAKAPDASQLPDAKPTSPTAAMEQPVIVEDGAQTATLDPEPDNQLARANRGVSFYDPRREKRYWAERNAHFATLDEALKAIALRYQRPIDWVADHMGEENDLGLIYANLNQQLVQEQAKYQGSPHPGSQTGSLSKKDSKEAALERIPNLPLNPSDSAAIASQRSESVTGPPGMTDKLVAAANTPGLDRSPLNGASNMQPNNSRKLSIDGAVSLEPLNGIQFYDPRRPKKYWVGPNERYDTLNAALKALAVQYNTTVQWVEGHIGNTNNLSEIHENLRNSLQP